MEDSILADVTKRGVTSNAIGCFPMPDSILQRGTVALGCATMRALLTDFALNLKRIFSFRICFCVLKSARRPLVLVVC